MDRLTTACRRRANSRARLMPDVRPHLWGYVASGVSLRVRQQRVPRRGGGVPPLDRFIHGGGPRPQHGGQRPAGPPQPRHPQLGDPRPGAAHRGRPPAPGQRARGDADGCADALDQRGEREPPRASAPRRRCPPGSVHPPGRPPGPGAGREPPPRRPRPASARPPGGRGGGPGGLLLPRRPRSRAGRRWRAKRPQTASRACQGTARRPTRAAWPAHG